MPALQRNSRREHLIYLPAHSSWLALRLKGKSVRIELVNERIRFRTDLTRRPLQFRD
jgi:hypothetical protein